jgi:hypothetical protein
MHTLKLTLTLTLTLCLSNHRLISALLGDVQEVYKHKRCPSCHVNIHSATTALRYGRILKQQEAILTQQKYIHEVHRQSLLLERHVSALHDFAGVETVARGSLKLIKDMERFGTETAHMLRRDNLSFQASDHPLAEHALALQANVLCIALDFTVRALMYGTPVQICTVTVQHEDALSKTKRAVSERDSSNRMFQRADMYSKDDAHQRRLTTQQTRSHAVKEIFKRTMGFISTQTQAQTLGLNSQLIDSEGSSFSSVIRVIQTAVPAMSAYTHVQDLRLDTHAYISRLLMQFREMITAESSAQHADMRQQMHTHTSPAQMQSTNTHTTLILHELVMAGLTVVPSLLQYDLLDDDVTLTEQVRSRTTVADTQDTGIPLSISPLGTKEPKGRSQAT